MTEHNPFSSQTVSTIIVYLSPKRIEERIVQTMFRKPKRKLKQSLRKKPDEDDTNHQPSTLLAVSGQEEEEEESTTAELLEEARKRLKQGKDDPNDAKKDKEKSLLHTFDTAGGASQPTAAASLATSTALHHPDKDKSGATDTEPGRGADGVFRQGRNKFWAGPIKASTNVRVTARFDYQPDICKDYKETGFCGFGDTCIYLHDRGDQLSGWQLEEKWQEEQRLKKEKQEKEMNDFLEASRGGKTSSTDNNATMAEDGLPFACHLCRNPFDEPVVTACQHYFCEKCIMSHVRNQSDACPICQKETHRVFNEPTKLIAKKRQVLGSREAKQPDSWKVFFEALSKKEGDAA